jgi:hypothetical protein
MSSYEGNAVMRYKVQTLLTSPEALERAQAYFGPQGKGLTVTSQHKRSLRWQDDNGHVSLIVKAESPTLLEIETRAWDEAVTQFIAQLPQKRSWWVRCWQRVTTGKSAAAGHSSGQNT